MASVDPQSPDFSGIELFELIQKYSEPVYTAEDGPEGVGHISVSYCPRTGEWRTVLRTLENGHEYSRDYEYNDRTGLTSYYGGCPIPPERLHNLRRGFDLMKQMQGIGVPSSPRGYPDVQQLMERMLYRPGIQARDIRNGDYILLEEDYKLVFSKVSRTEMDSMGKDEFYRLFSVGDELIGGYALDLSSRSFAVFPDIAYDNVWDKETVVGVYHTKRGWGSDKPSRAWKLDEAEAGIIAHYRPQRKDPTKDCSMSRAELCSYSALQALQYERWGADDDRRELRRYTNFFFGGLLSSVPDKSGLADIVTRLMDYFATPKAMESVRSQAAGLISQSGTIAASLLDSYIRATESLDSGNFRPETLDASIAHLRNASEAALAGGARKITRKAYGTRYIESPAELLEETLREIRTYRIGLAGRYSKVTPENYSAALNSIISRFGPDNFLSVAKGLFEDHLRGLHTVHHLSSTPYPPHSDIGPLGETYCRLAYDTIRALHPVPRNMSESGHLVNAKTLFGDEDFWTAMQKHPVIFNKLVDSLLAYPRDFVQHGTYKTAIVDPVALVRDHFPEAHRIILSSRPDFVTTTKRSIVIRKKDF